MTAALGKVTGRWTVSHVCPSSYRLVSTPRLVVVTEDEQHAFVKCEAVDCEFFAWRGK